MAAYGAYVNPAIRELQNGAVSAQALQDLIQGAQRHRM